MIKLPRIKTKGRFSLEELIMRRNSVRGYENLPVELRDLSQVLWSAYGSGTYGRTVPSAGACYPLRVYVVVKRVQSLSAGVYKYHHHFLELVKGEIKGFNYFNAPVHIVIASDPGKMISRYGKRGYQYITMEAGHSAQNITLQAISLGLGTVMIGAFRNEKIKKMLDTQDEPLYIIPLGVVKQ